VRPFRLGEINYVALSPKPNLAVCNAEPIVFPFLPNDKLGTKGIAMPAHAKNSRLA